MGVHQNPYIAGNPVGNTQAFVGREDVVHEVERVLRSPGQNAITLFGQRRIGKTSVLQFLTASLPQKGAYQTVFYDLQDKAAWPLSRAVEDLARTIAHKLGLPASELGEAAEDTFARDWLPGVLAMLPAGAALVLLFDEFDTLADPQAGQAAQAFFPYLRRLLALPTDRLKFVLVLGRNINDLNTIALSLFKGMPDKRVSLLTRPNAEQVMRLSERLGSLNWSAEAVERVWALAHGHPFLTQAMCWQVWERAHEEAQPGELPCATAAHVDDVVDDTLLASRNTLEWLWNGLGAAERVVISALAQAGSGPVSEARLEDVLRESGVRIIIRELRDAPQLLQEWDLIEPVDGGYAFRVELLRQWVFQRWPLSRVQKELDRIQPVAESLYQASHGMYEAGDLDGAVNALTQATRLNPHHLRAGELLGEIYISRNQLREAQEILEPLAEMYPGQIRPRLVQLYILQAQHAAEEEQRLDNMKRELDMQASPINRPLISGRMAQLQTERTSNEETRLALCEKVLALDPQQAEAARQRREIWLRRGDEAYQRWDLPAALNAFQQAGDSARAAQVETVMREEGELSQRFDEGQAAILRQDWPAARTSLQWVVSRRADYERGGQKAATLLAQAVSEGRPLEGKTRDEGFFYRRSTLIGLVVLLVLAMVVSTILGLLLANRLTNPSYVYEPVTTETALAIVQEMTDHPSAPTQAPQEATPAPTEGPAETPTSPAESSLLAISNGDQSSWSLINSWDHAVSGVNGLVISPDGQQVAVIDGADIDFYSLPTGDTIQNYSADGDISAGAYPPQAVQMPDSNTIMGALATGTTVSWLGEPFDVPAAPVALLFSPDVKTLVSVGQDSFISFIDLESKNRNDVAFDGQARAAAYAPDGQGFAISVEETGASSASHILIYDWQGNKLKKIYTGDPAAIDEYRINFTPDSTQVWSNQSGSLQQYDVSTTNVVEGPTPYQGLEARDFDVLPSENLVAILESDGLVKLFSDNTPEEGTAVRISPEMNHIQLTPDGRYLLAWNGEKIELWGNPLERQQ